MMFYLIVFLIVVRMTVGDPVRVPLYRCAFNDPCVDISDVDTGGSRRAILTLSNFFVRNTLTGATTNVPITLGGNSTFHYETRFHLEGQESIGMGPSSPIVNRHGSAALIRGSRNDSLVLGLSVSEFTNTCIADSIMTLSLADPEWMVDGVVEIITADGRLDRADTEPFYADITRRRNAFPREYVISIWDHLIAQGARFTERLDAHNDSLVMSNCTAEAVLSSPFIRFSFGDRNEQQIFLLPQDYIRRDPDTSTCTLLFGIIETPTMWVFAPLTIPQTNIFVNQTSLIICDSA